MPQGKLTEGAQGVRDLNLRPGVFCVRRDLLGADHGADGALAESVTDEAVPIEVLAFDGEEQVSRLGGPGIGTDAAYGCLSIAAELGVRDPCKKLKWVIQHGVCPL